MVLYNHNVNLGLFLGRIFQPPNQIVFNSGGAGYTLDKKALKVSLWNDVMNFFKCLSLQRLYKPDPERQHRHSKMLSASAWVSDVRLSFEICVVSYSLHIGQILGRCQHSELLKDPANCTV